MHRALLRPSSLTAFACYLADFADGETEAQSYLWKWPRLQQYLQLQHSGAPTMLPTCCDISVQPTTRLNFPTVPGRGISCVSSVPNSAATSRRPWSLSRASVSVSGTHRAPLPAAGLCPTDAQGTTFPCTVPRRASRRGLGISAAAGDGGADNDICCGSLTLNPASQNGGCFAGKGSGSAPTPSARGQEREGKGKKPKQQPDSCLFLLLLLCRNVFLFVSQTDCFLLLCRPIVSAPAR